MSHLRLVRNTALAERRLRLVPGSARVLVGAATDAAPASSSALGGMGMALPVFALGAVGAVFGGTLWGLTGLLGGALAGAGAGYGVTKLAGKSSAAAASAAAEEGGGAGGSGGAGLPSLPEAPPDFALPIPAKFQPPTTLGGIPKLPFLDEPTFIPTPSPWLPVSVVNSRERVASNRNLTNGTTITFIAQYGAPLRDAKDTSDEIKLSGTVVVNRSAVTDQDPAYGVEVSELVLEHNVRADVARPFVGQKMVVSPDQVLSAS